ncbi:MAG: hypothetical protein KF810_19095 [Rhizobiaceae bacterium]|nr:hypothetical protein [Rhizobiaceae bacterium]
MTMIMVRRVLFGAILAIPGFVSMPAMAQQSSPVTPSMLEQLTIADKLIAYGTERKDPILILAAVQLRANLADGAAQAAAATSTEDALKLASEYAGASAGIKQLIEEIQSTGSRGWDNSGYCYCFGSSCSCGH